ncbi:alpha-galactosidase [Medicago truncatula]|uniref:Alpha-galactosidase n=1 Tax=Medicago truncatula TaxID=3880 RepID=A0A072TTC0_MEDTR|nr:alpha-galactosidase [Medicago truncatula]
MIGAKGLKGSSWPDLDMLPFGWLTDADTNGGPHRYNSEWIHCYLIDDFMGFGKVSPYFPYVDSDGIRSWIATGRKGEVYLAFFNLNEQKTPVYAKTSDLAKVFPGIHISSCQGKEVWSGSVERTSQQRKE